MTLFSQSFLVNVDATIATLLEREDTDGDGQITIDDTGPQVRGWSLFDREPSSANHLAC
jgi:hypothetical protein